MITATTKAALKQLGIDPEQLIAAIKDTKEVEITVPQGSVYSDADIEEMKANVKKGHEQAYPEILGKTLNEKYELGLSTKDAKNIDKVMEAMEAKGLAKANIEPNKKVQELEASIKKLQEEAIPEYERKAKEWETKYNERLEYDSYSSTIPENANKFLTRDEHIARVKSRLKIGENGIAVDAQTGMPIKDKLEKPVLFKDAVAELYKSNETWVEPTSAAPSGGAKPFSHSTSAGAARKAGAFDHDAALQRVQSQYDMRTPEGRAAARTAMANEMIASNK
jgi:hypothetical protein